MSRGSVDGVQYLLKREEEGRQPSESVLLIRDPVLDLGQTEQGWELRYRGSPSDTSLCVDHARAARGAMHCALHVVGLDSLTHGKRAFLEVTPEVVLEEEYIVLPPERIVLQLQAPCEPTPTFQQACKRARRSGFAFAWRLEPLAAPARTLIETGDIIKLALQDAKSAATYLPRASDMPLLLYGVETASDLDCAKALGCTYVQGRFFCEPHTHPDRLLQGAEITQLNLLAELSKPEIDFTSVEAIVKADASLTYHLLRYLNSAAFGIRERVTSIRQALLLLGERPLRKWGSLVAIVSLGERTPHVLLVTSLTRARFCESLVLTRHADEQALDAFLTGLLSSLDALLGVQIAQLVKTLGLSDDVRAALLGERVGMLGTTLALAQATERGAWSTVESLATGLRLTHREVACRYYEALYWVHSLYRQ